MLTLQNAEVSLNSFREQSAGKRIVFFYPWENFRSDLLSHYLTQEHREVLYYRVTADESALPQMLNGIVEEFNRVLGTFGTNTVESLASHDALRMAQALASDLNGLPFRPVVVFFDQFERLPVDGELTEFLETLVESLNDDVQIALNSRLLSNSTMRGLVVQGKAALLGHAQHRRELFFTLESEIKPQLEVSGFGRGTASLDGKEIESWDGMLPRNLFFYLIDHPLVTRDEIFADFWRDVPLKDATDIFHVTKHKVTEVLGRRMSAQGDYEITQYKQGFYLPSENLVRHYDVAAFEVAVHHALDSADTHEMEILLRQALDLYQGHYLEDSETEWAVWRRDQLMRLHCEACIWMARILEQRGEAEAALDLYARAVEECPQREDVHRAIIHLHLQLGNIDRAREQYELLDSALYRALGISPTPASLELLREIDARGGKSSQ